jgi:pyridoxal phosphate enzyme (YggS family)
MIPYEEFVANTAVVRARIADACAACGRASNSVALLPVTKTHPVDAAIYAHRAGFVSVGENRVQEAVEKRPSSPAGLRWELIGHLQSNKAKLAVATFDRIQSVDSTELALRLDRIAGESGKKLPVLLQANAGADPAKFGADFDGLAALLDAALASPNLRVDGLMTIAPLDESPDVARRCFDNLRTWRDSLATSRAVALPELSMGMSGDLEHAIAAGSTVIRVGTALFGSR